MLNFFLFMFLTVLLWYRNLGYDRIYSFIFFGCCIVMGVIFIENFSNVEKRNKKIIRTCIYSISLLFSIGIILYFSPVLRLSHFTVSESQRFKYIFDKYFPLLLINFIFNLGVFVVSVIMEYINYITTTYLYFFGMALNIFVLFVIPGLNFIEFIGLIMIGFSAFALDMIDDLEYSLYYIPIIYISFFFACWISNYITLWNTIENIISSE